MSPTSKAKKLILFQRETRPMEVKLDFDENNLDAMLTVMLTRLWFFRLNQIVHFKL